MRHISLNRTRALEALVCLKSWVLSGWTAKSYGLNSF